MAIPLAYNLRNLVVRKTTTIMTALGIALTVSVLVAVLALVDGLQSALQVSGNPLNVLQRPPERAWHRPRVGRPSACFARDHHGHQPAEYRESRWDEPYTSGCDSGSIRIARAAEIERGALVPGGAAGSCRGQERPFPVSRSADRQEAEVRQGRMGSRRCDGCRFRN